MVPTSGFAATTSRLATFNELSHFTLTIVVTSPTQYQMPYDGMSSCTSTYRDTKVHFNSYKMNVILQYRILYTHKHKRNSALQVPVTGRRGDLMVSALDFGASGPGLSPGRGHCVVFLGKTLHSHGASLHPGV